MEGSFPYDKYSHSSILFGRILQKNGYDLIYVLPPSFSSALMAYSAKIPQKIGYSGSLRGFLLNQNVQYAQKHRSSHLINEYLFLVNRRFTIDEFLPKLDTTKDWVENTLNKKPLLLPDDFIVIAPGVIFGPAKQWPIEYFKKLVTLLGVDHKKVVVVGTESDFELGESLAATDQRCINLCGKTTLNELIAVLAKSKLLVSNDSGTMHIMAALQKPQVAIFGSTSTIWTGPVNPKAKIVTLDMECAPCFKRKCRFGHTKLSEKYIS